MSITIQEMIDKLNKIENKQYELGFEVETPVMKSWEAIDSPIVRLIDCFTNETIVEIVL